VSRSSYYYYFFSDDRTLDHDRPRKVSILNGKKLKFVIKGEEKFKFTGAQSLASMQAKTRAEMTMLSPASMSWKRKTRKLKLLSNEERASLCGCCVAMACKFQKCNFKEIK
jgi:hypothetical protein